MVDAAFPFCSLFSRKDDNSRRTISTDPTISAPLAYVSIVGTCELSRPLLLRRYDPGYETDERVIKVLFIASRYLSGGDFCVFELAGRKFFD